MKELYNNVTLRLEQPEDYKKAEEVTREAF